MRTDTWFMSVRPALLDVIVNGDSDERMKRLEAAIFKADLERQVDEGVEP